MDLEEAAVEIRDLAEQLFQVAVQLAFVRGLAQAVVEQPQQEVAVERQEFVLALGLANELHAVAQVIGVAVEEAFLLDEVDEHQAVEHEGRVPLQVGVGLDALDELEEGGVFGLEAFVELLGDLVDIERRAGAAGHFEHVKSSFFLLQRDEQ